jgi:Leucine-rich repeat (LRR) protein
LKLAGNSFLKLTNLSELFIQGHTSIFYDKEFVLPEEIGNLTGLKKLSLLNLPIAEFPIWITNLKDLEYLMIRGTDLVMLPGSIRQLTKLKTLRIENCPLATLPIELSELTRLKQLGLSDTKVTALDKYSLPHSLRRISLAGTSLFSSNLTSIGTKLRKGHVS